MIGMPCMSNNIIKDKFIMEKVHRLGKEIIISESLVATPFLTKLIIKLWLKRHTSAKSEMQRDKHFTCMSMYG